LNRIAATSLLLLAAAPLSFGIVIRHDRDDARYQELAKKYRAPVAVLTLGGQGTLVHPKWIATAAHVADGMNPFTFATIGGKTVRVKAAYQHPSWKPGQRNRSDLALLELEEPVTSVEPVKFYTRQDELGKRVIFVGEGYTGDGLTGPTKRDGAWRAAHNTISEVDEASIRFVFNRPPAGEDLEGISGPGDSGGPALIEENGTVYLAGTSGSNSAPRGGGHCTYDTIESYGRVSTNIAWLNEVMAGKGEPMPMGVLKSFRSGWPDLAAAEPAKAYLDAYNSGRAEAVVEVIERFATPQQVAGATRESRIETVSKRFAEHAKLTPVGLYQESDRLSVLVQSEKTGRHFLVIFEPRQDKFRIGLQELPPVPIKGLLDRALT
jgi:hypothetical protein